MIDVKVTYKGGLFSADLTKVVEAEIHAEILDKVEERTARQGKRIGAQRNTITHKRNGLELGIASTLRHPRNTGRTWQGKNIGIIKSMAPRVGNKAGQRIAERLEGGG